MVKADGMMVEERGKVLRPWEEIVGVLKDIHSYDDLDSFQIEIEGVGFLECMYIPGSIEFLKRITKIPKGTKIGILRTDDDFRVRTIK